MKEREKFTVKLEDGNEFSFYMPPQTIVEKQKIKQEAVELSGGWDNYSSLEASVESTHLKYLEWAEKQFGVTGFADLQRKLLELRQNKQDKTEEYEQLFEKLYNNVQYLKYANLLTTLTDINNYAYMIVMCVSKPANFNFKEQPEAYLKQILKEVQKQNNFFRTEVKQTQENGLPGQDGAGNRSDISAEDKGS